MATFAEILEQARQAQAANAGVTPTTGDTPERRNAFLEFFFGPNRQTPTAAMLGRAAAGEKSTFDEYGFYDALAEAQRTGRGIAGQQQALADILQARAEGRGGPSLAELQLAQSLEANRRAAAGALAGAGRAINPAAAQRLLLQQQSTLGQQAAGQGALLRAQEQLAAQQALGQQLTGMRGAEQAQFASAGQLGLSQEKLGVETQEAQRARELDVALANQRAEQERQRVQAGQEASIASEAAANRRMIGELGVEAGKAIAGAAQGGVIGKDVKRLDKLDNKKNDVVPAMLSEGEIVVPRSIVASPNAPLAAAKFVEALLAKKDKGDAKMTALKAALASRKK